MRVIVTRPQPQADEWVEKLKALGVEAIALPLLAIADAPDPGAIAAAWSALPGQALVMFVSPSAVQRFFARRPATGGWPAATLAGSTGPGTMRALEAAGVPPVCIVSPPADAPRFDSEALWDLLAKRRDWRGCAVMIVRGEGGRDWLAGRLRGAGAEVTFIEAYRRAAPVLDTALSQVLRAALDEPLDHRWFFSSSEGVDRLATLAPDAGWSAAAALATHPRIAEAARRLGFADVVVVPPSPQAVAEAMAAWTRPIQSPPP